MFFSSLVLVSLLFLVNNVSAACNNGVAGNCQDYRYEACQGAIRSSGGSPYYLTGYCPGDKYNKCCKGSDPDPVVPVPDPIGDTSGGVFPVTSGSLGSISVNWGGSRSGGSRCHAGIDLYTTGSARIQAVAAGVVTSIMRGWYTCSGGSIDAIMVYHTSGPVAGKTINYGEVNPGTYGSLRVGSQVQAGTPLGTFTRCGMIHFELYNGRQSGSARWYPAGGSVGNAFNGCARNSLSTKPSQLMDPRPIIRQLMPSNARFHAGTSFLNDDADASFANDEQAIPDSPSTDPSDDGGTIAAVVVSVIVIIVIIIGIAIFFVLRRRSNDSSLVVSNSIYMQTGNANDMMSSARNDNNNSGGTIAPGYTNQGAAGSFTCGQCGKEYSFAEDLSQHVALRH